MDKPIIAAHDIHKSFGDSEILRGISLNLEHGELLSIMGPSGSGKSTLLHCLAGIMDTDAGSVVYKGHSLSDLSQNDKAKLRRTDFGFIFQFGELIPELPVRDNVALPLLLKGIKKARAYRLADQWLGVVDITYLARHFPHTLSGGETQRVAIARAMAADPKIIFADEPTGSLDSINTKKVMELFVKLAHHYNKSVIYVTHSEELAKYANRVVVLHDGLIASEHRL